ncbi:MAG: HD domain-containing protein [Alphaproteobacteria bacterium]|nr:HD domain-containing protein [Alphaproteobacteria bacterium]
METSERAVEAILEIFRAEGARNYGGERLSQTAHALQCGLLAEKAGASSALVSAALLHDIGHLVNPHDGAAKRRGEDGFHEVIGCDYLSRWFGPTVTHPIMWHVAAKRYLTAVEPGYFSGLSQGSVRSLELQGGPYTPERAEKFIERPFAKDAVMLRRWDEAAKNPHIETPPLEHFRPHLEASLSEQ